MAPSTFRIAHAETTSTFRIAHAETIGATTLLVVERIRSRSGAATYSLERVRETPGGENIYSVYATKSFSSLSEAIEAGRDWCQPENLHPIREPPFADLSVRLQASGSM
jgi:hypothetical protein